MKDSCRPSKLEPGFPATYSSSISFRTWTMRSDPDRWTARTLTGGRTAVASLATCSWVGAGTAAAVLVPLCAAACGVSVTRDAALAAAPAAAPFRKPRRFNDPSFLATVHSPVSLQSLED